MHSRKTSRVHILPAMASPVLAIVGKLPASYIPNTEVISALSRLDCIFRLPSEPLTPERLKGGSVEVVFAHSTRECAFHERLFTAAIATPMNGELGGNDLSAFRYCELHLRVPLTIATFYGPDRHRLERLVPSTAKPISNDDFAALVFILFPDVHGVMWTSECCDPDTTIALFPKRLPSGAVELANPPIVILDDEVLRAELTACANRAGLPALGR